jgi:hypothetical protein
MQTDLNITLAEYKPIAKYEPRVGDVIIWHGWFTHYYGIINGINQDAIRIIKAGMPLLLFTMDTDDMSNPKNIIMLSIHKIRKSRGEYAVQQGNIWYV